MWYNTPNQEIRTALYNAATHEFVAILNYGAVAWALDALHSARPRALSIKPYATQGRYAISGGVVAFDYQDAMGAYEAGVYLWYPDDRAERIAFPESVIWLFGDHGGFVLAGMRHAWRVGTDGKVRGKHHSAYTIRNAALDSNGTLWLANESGAIGALDIVGTYHAVTRCHDPRAAHFWNGVVLCGIPNEPLRVLYGGSSELNKALWKFGAADRVFTHMPDNLLIAYQWRLGLFNREGLRAKRAKHNALPMAAFQIDADTFVISTTTRRCETWRAYLWRLSNDTFTLLATEPDEIRGCAPLCDGRIALATSRLYIWHPEGELECARDASFGMLGNIAGVLPNSSILGYSQSRVWYWNSLT